MKNQAMNDALRGKGGKKRGSTRDVMQNLLDRHNAVVKKEAAFTRSKESGRRGGILSICLRDHAGMPRDPEITEACVACGDRMRGA